MENKLDYIIESIYNGNFSQVKEFLTGYTPANVVYLLDYAKEYYGEDCETIVRNFLRKL